MLWRGGNRPPPLALIDGDTLNLKALSPMMAGILKAYLGKLDITDLEQRDRDHVLQFYNALQGEGYTLQVRAGPNFDYGSPIAKIKAKPPDIRRK